MEITKNPSAIHNLDNNANDDGASYKTFFAFIGSAIILGVLAGFIIAFFQKGTKNNNSSNSSNTVTAAKTAGIADKKTFKDSAEGILREGGIDGEGTYHLERPGGESQNVYLTSTTVDLSPYVGKKVKVWGQTYAGDKAGWLMDVGWVEMQ